MSAFNEDRGSKDVKDKLLVHLMKPKEKPRGPLIQDLTAGEEDVIEMIPGVATDISSIDPSKQSNEIVVSNVPAVDEGPTMMEMMLAAQAEAAKSSKEEKKKEEKKESKGFGSGFKGGFLNGGKKSASKKKSDDSKSIPTLKATNPYEAQRKGLAGKSETITQVQKEVQKAMEEQQDPMVNELKRGEWMTPELVKQFAQNPIISRGLADPRCTDAMQLMQKNPEEAKKKYHGDPQVDLFLREFGKVMAGHFEKLGQFQDDEKKKKNEMNKNNDNKTSIIEASSTKKSAGNKNAAETCNNNGLGPLAEQAVKRQQQSAQKSSSVEEEKRVQDIVNNPELTKLLMDPNMQRVLQECSNSTLFQKHMSNPATARKIKILFDAGLVGTAK